MRYLILSDIHSNLEAFERCLEIADGLYDELLCLGDLVGYGPDPNAVVDAIRGRAAHTIRGNHDKACCGLTDAEDFNPLARAATLWTREQLSPDNLDWLRSLPAGPLTVDGFELVHGSPRDEDEYVVDGRDAEPSLEEAASPLVFFGHTHLQGGFMQPTSGRVQPIHCVALDDGCFLTLVLEPQFRYLLNPGSVGQPRDRNWRAAFAILNLDRRQVEFYRTAYDLVKTQEKMRAANLPAALITRLEYGR